MSIRKQATKDLEKILESDKSGFGWDIKLTAPDGVTKDFIGFSNDVAVVIDPDTGVIVSGRTASIALNISSINKAFPGKELPRGIANSSMKPWLVEFYDVNENNHKFKISESNPDRALGIITCILELYEK